MVMQPAEKMPDVPSYKVYLVLFIYFKRNNTLFSSVYKLCTSFFTDNFILCCCLNVSVCDYYSLCWSLSFCQQFFFKSQVIASNKFTIGKCEDFVWVTKDELMEYFPESAEFLNKMIISWCTSPILTSVHATPYCFLNQLDKSVFASKSRNYPQWMNFWPSRWEIQIALKIMQ